MQQNLPPITPSPSRTSLINQTFQRLILLISLCVAATGVQAGSISGDLTKWAPMNIDFTGPTAAETDTSPNPFLDYRLTVNFTSPDGSVHVVPGFFAGDGNGGGQGNQWRVRFAADQVGLWRYQANLKSGDEIAIDTNAEAGSDVAIDGPTGEFSITTQASDAPGFLAHGRLEYTGEHYLKFRDGPYWIKSGTDSPENFLGYEGIDGTVDQGGGNFLHDFAQHRGDARSDDPIFSNASSGADSLGITGALNYLSEQGVNSIYFLPMNLGGDGQETFPFVGGTKTRFNKTHYDISKLYQWNQVLSHAQRRGVALNIVLSETEVDNERWLDNGAMGVERKLYFRELIARFGYLLAAKWNLGEENDFPVSELREQASYLKALDWTQKPIAVHTQINNFRDYEQLVGDELFSATSIQYDPERANEFVETWRKRSADSGRRWVIDMDENTGGISNTNADTRRKQILYDVYFSGGNLEWYYGYHPLPLGGDITAGDFRQREAMWKMMRYARSFMESQLPFWRMQPADQLVSGEANSFGGAQVFAAPGEIYAIYLPNASGNAALDLSDASGSFSLQWYNPRNGQFVGDATSIVGGERVALGSAPSSTNDDWVVLVKSHNAPALPEFGPVNTPDIALQDPAALPDPQTQTSADDQPTDLAVEPTDEGSTTNDAETTDTAQDALAPETEQVDAAPIQPNEPPVFLDIGELLPAMPGEFYSLSVTATDAEGVAPVVTADTLPPGMRFSKVADGVANIEWQVPSELTEAVTFELIAIDVQDNNLRTTLSITIPIESTVLGTEPEETDSSVVAEPATNTLEGNVEALSDDAPITPIGTDDLPPLIFGASDTQTSVAQTLRVTIIPVDPEGIVAALRLQTDRSGVEFIDNGNGSRDLVWTPVASDIGTHELRFIATDSGATPHVVQQLMRVSVIAETDAASDSVNSEEVGNINYQPIFVPVNNQQVRQGDNVSFLVKPIDPDGSAPILHVASPPAGASFDDNGDGSRTFSWDVPDDYTGTVTLRFIATDSNNLSVTIEQEVLVEVLP